ncbi:amino-acid transporter subunit; membrane component of ABC superfamily [Rubrivivax sp. A210]|uniref:amino acid ABC transporter permease n=1 Tax=Rubrivivax sp. A210 TaxID=2772301 RepID=UPI0019191A5F|nr:amino acid ABC transporter permease [Rubrivivax sp. A210]CAD5375089.1 amino-acid transporter subunit; membrane component of ABC superfamily [Rubrivivax sp. A210]
MSATFTPIEPRPAPVKTEGLVPWMRRNLFGNLPSAVVTLLMAGLALWLLPQLFSWAVLHAVTAANADQCQAARGVGACWGVITEKHRLIIFGRYPFDQQWRPEIATLALVALLVASCVRTFWKPWLLLLWAAVLGLFFTLMLGGVLGLAPVTTDRWGGLPLTIMLATLSIVFAFPLAVAVALGRRSNMPAIKTICVIYVELIRGVPLISVLFMASFMFPLFMPPGTSIDVLLRVLVGITLFAAAYMAEIVRGGLQAIPKGQQEAADTLGLSYWQAQRKIILPQALALVVPGIMNNFIAIFKDTSLVTIVSLYELTGAMGLALNSDSDWRPFKIEAYLFIAAIYFTFCFSMSRYSLWIEKRLSMSKNR